MSRLFLGTSFSGHVDYETGQVHPEYREHVEEILKALRDLGGYSVFCAVEHEGWVIPKDVPPEVGVKVDLDEIDASEIMLALIPTGLISGGLQYEIGYANAKGKKIVMATEAGSDLAYFNQGAVNLGYAVHVAYDSPETLVTNIKQTLA